MEDLWMVVGGTPTFWRDLISPIFPTTPSGRVLVLKLDNSSAGSWAFRASFEGTGQQWIEQNLS
jgi:hypothetical protein